MIGRYNLAASTLAPENGGTRLTMDVGTDVDHLQLVRQAWARLLVGDTARTI